MTKRARASATPPRIDTIVQPEYLTLPGLLPETTASLSELLKHGTAEEVRIALGAIGRGMLADPTRPLPKGVAEWIGTAFVTIANLGTTPRLKSSQVLAALGLNRKTAIGVERTKFEARALAALKESGLSTEEAAEVVARINFRETSIRKEKGASWSGNDVTALVRRLQRWRKATTR